MRNPWKEFKSAPLGRIFEKIGGGGHQRVATIVLKSAKSDEAPDVLEAVVSSIRRHERSRIDHRDRTVQFLRRFWILHSGQPAVAHLVAAVRCSVSNVAARR